jgi:Phage integrase, N-terminal SAM-like domain
MGYSKKRIDRNGKPRYTACYLDVRGSLRSAGTYSNKKDADKAWQKSEIRVGEGRLNDPRRGRQTFRRYVTEEWLPHHVIEASTREAYTYQIGKHILPWFGPMRMNEIMPSHVREWVTDGNGVEARLRQAASLPEALAAGFDAFEAIRMAARRYQDQVPELFAAFMTTADAAVDGGKP